MIHFNQFILFLLIFLDITSSLVKVGDDHVLVSLAVPETNSLLVNPMPATLVAIMPSTCVDHTILTAEQRSFDNQLI